MIVTWYHAAYADGGKYLRLCSHLHATIISAAACMSTAGEYVVASENGLIRALTTVEEVEYEYAQYGKVLKPISGGCPGGLHPKESS
ncbi:MAG TPA: hypothetical protein VGQ61_12305 [Candidatus Angelobacter sp.]|jgi:hypothetical protein|nr:hypothetical protein [Candidatus Angelobacter sp.]